MGNVTHIPGREVEYSVRWRTHPFAQVSSVSQRDTASDDAGLDICLCRYVASSRNDHFVGGTNFATNELDLICDEKPDVLDILALTPSS